MTGLRYYDSWKTSPPLECGIECDDCGRMIGDGEMYYVDGQSHYCETCGEGIFDDDFLRTAHPFDLY